MKKLLLPIIRKQVVACLQANPAEAILGICFFVFFIISESLPYPDKEVWINMPFMYPSLFVLVYSSHSLFSGKSSFVYYLSLLSLIPLILLSGYLKEFIDSPAYGFTLLLTAFLLLGGKKTADNTSFAQHSVRLFIHALFAVIIGLLLIAIVAAIYHSVIYIFDWNRSGSFIDYVAHFTFYLFTPLFFCHLQQEESTDKEALPGLMQFVLNYLLSPAILVYTVVLYLYFIVIVVHWELPKGGVAYMVMAFFLFSMAGRMSQLIVSKRYYDWFYRPLGFIAVPPLILFWIGTIYRVYMYSLTESRVYLLAAGVLMTLFVFFLYNKRLGSYRLMLLISALAIVVLTYIPGISARSIGISSQASRMESLARNLSLWDVRTDKLAGTENFQQKDSVLLNQAHELNACYDYLEKEQGREKVILKWGRNHLNKILQEAIPAYFDRPNGEIDIKGYNRYLSGCRISMSCEDTLKVMCGERLLLSVEGKSHFALYKDKMALWDKEALDIEPFCFKNDSCMVVIGSLTRTKSGEYTLSGSGDVQVFCK